MKLVDVTKKWTDSRTTRVYECQIENYTHIIVLKEKDSVEMCFIKSNWHPSSQHWTSDGESIHFDYPHSDHSQLYKFHLSGNNKLELVECGVPLFSILSKEREELISKGIRTVYIGDYPHNARTIRYPLSKAQTEPFYVRDNAWGSMLCGYVVRRPDSHTYHSIRLDSGVARVTSHVYCTRIRKTLKIYTPILLTGCMYPVRSTVNYASIFSHRETLKIAYIRPCTPKDERWDNTHTCSSFWISFYEIQGKKHTAPLDKPMQINFEHCWPSNISESSMEFVAHAIGDTIAIVCLMTHTPYLLTQKPGHIRECASVAFISMRGEKSVVYARRIYNMRTSKLSQTHLDNKWSAEFIEETHQLVISKKLNKRGKYRVGIVVCDIGAMCPTPRYVSRSLKFSDCTLRCLAQ